MEELRHFTAHEVEGLNPDFAAKLDIARDLAGVPFVLTSTVRTAEENSACGGANNSTHCKGLAVDIGLSDFPEGYDRDNARFSILKGLIAVGFKRIGIYMNHIHVDSGDGPDYAQNVAWDSANA